MPLLEYITNEIGIFIATMICSTTAFALINACALYFFNKKTTGCRLVLGTVCMTLLLHLPQWGWGYISLYAYIWNGTADSILLFPNPLFLPIYYLIFSRIFECTKEQSILLMEWAITGQYFLLTAFRMLYSVCHLLANLGRFHGDEALEETVAMGIILLFAFCAYRYIRSNLQKTRRFLILPYGFSFENTEKKSFATFVRILLGYFILVSVCTLMMNQRFTEITFTQALLYFVLACVMAYSLTDSVKGLMITISYWQTEETQKYVSSLILANETFRGIKHDFYNLLQVYDGYIRNADTEGMKEFHSSLVKTTVSAGNSLEQLTALRSRVAIYTLFEIKREAAAQKGVLFSVQHIDSLADVEMNDFDLSRIFSNLLDNAIEAASEAEKKKVEVDSRRERGKVNIVLANTSSQNVDMDMIFEAGYTTKANHSGRGLPIVNHILEAHEGCFLQSAFAEGVFTITLSLATRQENVPL